MVSFLDVGWSELSRRDRRRAGAGPAQRPATPGNVRRRHGEAPSAPAHRRVNTRCPVGGKPGTGTDVPRIARNPSGAKTPASAGGASRPVRLPGEAGRQLAELRFGRKNTLSSQRREEDTWRMVLPNGNQREDLHNAFF